MKKQEKRLVDSVEKPGGGPSRCAHAAQQKFATYTQEQVDKIFPAAAMRPRPTRRISHWPRWRLRRPAWASLRIRSSKNHYAAEYIYNAYRDVKDLRSVSRRTRPTASSG